MSTAYKKHITISLIAFILLNCTVYFTWILNLFFRSLYITLIIRSNRKEREEHSIFLFRIQFILKKLKANPKNLINSITTPRAKFQQYATISSWIQLNLSSKCQMNARTVRRLLNKKKQSEKVSQMFIKTKPKKISKLCDGIKRL